MEYTKLTVDDLLTSFRMRLANNGQFKKIEQSAIYPKFIEFLTECCDYTNFYAQRTAEEASINSAKIDSNVIKHCQNLGYQPRRPIPAQAKLIIRLKGPLPSTINKAGTEIFFNQKNILLTYNDKKFMLDSSYSYVLTQEDIDFGSDPDWQKDLVMAVPHNNSVFMPLQGTNFVNVDNTLPIKCFQGEVKTYELKGNTILDKLGKAGQTYNIPDKSFSNWYGKRDPYAYNGDRNYFQRNSWCKIGIGETKEDAFQDSQLFDIETQAIKLNKKYRAIKPEESTKLYYNLYDVISQSKYLDKNYAETRMKELLNQQLRICLIESNPDKSVKISFGRDHNILNGLMKQSDNLYVQYISTEGKAANQTGIIGNKFDHNNTIYTSLNGNVINLTNNIEFVLDSDIYGGDDFESQASMKINGPAYYRRRNKLIMLEDFQNYFSTLTAPMYVHHAYVAGQHEIETIASSQETMPLLQNYILYSLMGKQYLQNSGNYTPRNVLTSDDQISDPFSLYEDKYKAHIADYLKFLISPIGYTNYQYATDNQETWVKNVQQIRENCKDNLPINTTLLSVPPFIHYFDLVGDVTVKPSANLEEYNTRMQNKVYKYLDDISADTQKIYKADIIKLYMEDEDTESVDIDIKISNLIQSYKNIYEWKNDPQNGIENFKLVFNKTLDSYKTEIALLKYKYAQELEAALQKAYDEAYAGTNGRRKSYETWCEENKLSIIRKLNGTEEAYKKYKLVYASYYAWYVVLTLFNNTILGKKNPILSLTQWEQKKGILSYDEYTEKYGSTTYTVDYGDPLPENLYGSSPFNMIVVNKYDKVGKLLNERQVDGIRIKITYYSPDIKQTVTRYVSCKVESDENCIYLILPIFFYNTTDILATGIDTNSLQITLQTEDDFESTSKFNSTRVSDYKIPYSYKPDVGEPLEQIKEDLLAWINNFTINAGADRAINLPYYIFAGNKFDPTANSTYEFTYYNTALTHSEEITRKGNEILNHSCTLSEASFWNYLMPSLIKKYYINANGEQLLQNDTLMNNEYWIGASKLAYDLYALFKPGICDSILDDNNNIVNFSLNTECAVLINKVAVSTSII